MYICAKAPDKMKTTVSVFAAFFFISVLSVSCQGDPGDFNTTFSDRKVDEYVARDTALYHGRVMLESAHI